ncbi:MAG TPA: helix-turn-helix domain-containing protein [Aggregatilineaceae bacterium]|nr:helix-turn-helix domain-containing protein [Aggregatilineaceae bacterium]
MKIRSHCPINYALELWGDRWSLLIIRDMVIFGKKTYGEFLESEEKIATNILASRLDQLEQNGIVVKEPSDVDKRKEIYRLTEKGLDLIPILLEIGIWSAKHDAETDAPADWIALVKADKERIAHLVWETVQRGGSAFVGPDSVISQLVGADSKTCPTEKTLFLLKGFGAGIEQDEEAQ